MVAATRPSAESALYSGVTMSDKEKKKLVNDAIGSQNFNYTQYSAKKYMIIAIGIVLCVVFFFLDVVFSSTYIDPAVIIDNLLHPGRDDIMHIIVFDIKIPVGLMALICGASFGFAGAIMQTMLNNPLASPYTLGISAGAGFGAALAMVTGLGGMAVLGEYLIPGSAFLFALLACGGIFLVAKVKGFSADIMVLAGIGLVFFFQALQALMQYLASPEALQGIVFWTFGSLTGSDWENIPIVLAMFVIIFILIYRKAWFLTAMKLGDSKAAALGIDTNNIRKWMFVAVSLLTATCVAFVGCIGFIGIVGPHVARMILGEDQRFLIPMSCVCGAAILTMADVASKVIGNGVIFPIGILTSLVGVPFFFYLLLKKKKAVA